jgi:superoxide dismutase
MGYTNDKEDWSFVHRADRSVCRGRKLWSLGSQGAHQSWWQNLAEPNWVPYAELQSGLLPVQPDTGILAAGQSISWTEAFTSVQGSAKEQNYCENFATFERRGLEKTDPSWNAWNHPDFWQILESKTLVESDARLAISKKLILTGTLSEEEIHEAIDTGWVGGDKWIELLEHQQPALSKNACLALAVAKINQNAPDDARAILLCLTDTRDEASAYANHFLGLLAAEADEADEACARLHRSVNEGYSDTHLLISADQVFSRFGRHNERKLLWQHVSPEARNSDDCRLAQASLAFLDGDWNSVRSLLAAPLLSIAEGATYPWLLFKESYFGEFAEKISKGDFEGALDALASGSQAFPQFDIGRQEDRQNVDFLFYRYQLCKQQGWNYLESAFANMILIEPEYRGSPEALYVYHVAKIEHDPTASARLKAIETWNQTSPDWQKYQPLRHALNQQVLENSGSGWNDLAEHPLYRYRAQFELATFQDLPALINPPSNTAPAVHGSRLQAAATGVR